MGAALVAEYAPAARRGLFAALVHTGYSWGWAMSTVAYLVIFHTFEPDVAWRYLFLVGLLPALLAIWVRLTVRDRVPATGKGAPLAFGRLFRDGRARTTILCTLLGAGAQGIFYSAFVFMPIYLARVRELPIGTNAQAIFSIIAGCIVGIAAIGPVTIGSVSAGLGLGTVIVIIGVASCVLALVALWQLPETRGIEILDDAGHAGHAGHAGAATAR